MTKAITINKDLSWKITSIFCLSALAMMLPELSLATTEDPIGDTLCNIVTKLQGRIGKGIATIAVIFLGIGLFLGKLSWGLAIAIGIGIGGIFGAGQLVNWMGSSGYTASGVAACGNS